MITIRNGGSLMVNSGAKGKRGERDVVRYLAANGWPSARREVRTGDLRTADEGDIVLTGLTVEVKFYDGGLTEGSVTTYLRKLSQVQKRPGDIGLLIERRQRVAEPGRWWCHATPEDAARLLTGCRLGHAEGGPCVCSLDRADCDGSVAVRMPLSVAVERLNTGGWADDPRAEVQALYGAAGHADDVDDPASNQPPPVLHIDWNPRRDAPPPVLINPFRPRS